MPLLSNTVLGAVEKQRIRVFFADREATRRWNNHRGPLELRFFGGWYWYLEKNGKAAGPDNGPFRSESAAFRDAFVRNNMSQISEAEASAMMKLKERREKKAARERPKSINKALSRARKHLVNQ